MTDGPAISLVVPFRNAERHLRELLESLVDQTVRQAWEIVLVDNGSSDRSKAIVDTFSCRLPLEVVSAPFPANESYARNVGARKSRGAKLLFVDADDALAPGYVSSMALALDSHPLVTSRVDSETLNPEWVRGAQGPPWQAEGISVFFDFLPAAGINIGIRRDLFDALVGFPEELSPSADIAFSWNAKLTAGIDLQFVHDAVYRYRYRDSLRDLFGQSRGWGKASVGLYQRYRHAGMPPRPFRRGLQEWWAVVQELSKASGRADRAPVIVRLGYCLGRAAGSLRYRVSYL